MYYCVYVDKHTIKIKTRGAYDINARGKLPQ